tara:strand:- start:799 stop:1488 length:690 start_codon:yes stop_codon:yes gene_type:complete
MANKNKFPDLPRIPAIAGIRIAGIAAGLKDNGKHDLFVAELAPGKAVAGTLTRSLCPGAPVEWNKRQLSAGKVRAIVASSGNSNVFTGKQGRDLVANTAVAAAKAVGCRPAQVLLASTGIIGEKRETTFVSDKVSAAFRKLTKTGWYDSARSIMATDRFPKAAVRKVKIGNVEVSLEGIAIGDVAIAESGETVSGFDADTVVRHLKSDQVQISVDIGIGRGKARAWAAL